MSQNMNSVLLDVDPSIIEKNIMITKDSNIEDIKKYFAPEKPTSCLVKPKPGFCVKSWMKNENQKVFINVCHTYEIPPPDDITEDELINILSSDTPSCYRVPMSLGEAHIENDKSKKPATVYDAAINSGFFEKIQKSVIFQNFFLRVVFEGLQDKYQFELNTENFFILKNKKSTGTLQAHRIQNRDIEKIIDKTYTPLIEEIKAMNEDVPRNGAVKVEKNKPTELKYTLRRETIDGKITFLIGEFIIDKRISSSDLLLDVGEDRIIVEVPKMNQITDIFVPCTIQQKNINAVLNQNTGILTVKMAANN